MVQEGVELGPWRSQQFKGIPELQKNGLQAVEEAWMTISRLRHFSVKFGRFLCFRGSPELQKGGLRALEEAWMTTFIQVEALLESLDGRVLDTSGCHPGFFQGSPATVLEPWAYPDLLEPPWTQLDLLEPREDAPEAQKTTKLDREVPQSESRHPGFF